MAAITGLTVPSTGLPQSATTFTKSFTVTYETASAVTEVHFNKKELTVTIESVRAKDNDGKLHPIPVADDNSLTPQQKIAFYVLAAQGAAKFLKKFPTGNTQHPYEDWEAEIGFKANSAEEAFIYWVLFYLLPPEYVPKYQQLVGFIQEKPYPFWEKNLTSIEAVMNKAAERKPLDKEEKRIFNLAKNMLKPNEVRTSEKMYQSTVWKDFQTMQFPQKLSYTEYGLTLENMIKTLGEANLIDRIAFYQEAKTKHHN